jgi:hypothetical protein
MDEIADTYKVLVESRRRKQLGRPKCRWKDDIKTNLNKKWYENVDWIELADPKGSDNGVQYSELMVF